MPAHAIGTWKSTAWWRVRLMLGDWPAANAGNARVAMHTPPSWAFTCSPSGASSLMVSSSGGSAALDLEGHERTALELDRGIVGIALVAGRHQPRGVNIGAVLGLEDDLGGLRIVPP